MTAAELDDVFLALRAQLAELAYPTPANTIRALVERASPTASLVPYFLGRACDELVWDGVAGQGRALGIATTYGTAVIALLRGSAVPMRTREVVARLGAGVLSPEALRFDRGVLKPEVLRFDRGVIGLKQHFADFDAWCERLGPACLEHMLSAPQRQWSANELLRLLKAEGRPLPTGCTTWQLVALLRHTPGLRYLGRQRFSLDRSPPKRRTYHFEAIRHVLESQRAPMSFEEIVAALEPSMSVEREVVRATLSRRDFVQSADGAWSLRAQEGAE